MKISEVLIAILSLTILIGCSSPKIGTSSDESMKASIEKVRQSLPKEKKEQFDEALKIIAFDQINLKDIFSTGAEGIGITEAKMKEALNGKTGNDVIAEAEKIKRERKEKEKLQAIEEIKELEKKKAKAEQARSELANFKVLRSRFYKRKQKFLGAEPIIEVTVKNGTRHAVSRGYFMGTLSSPNRSVPWLKESFNHQISGGLEPGEEATWHLAPNMFSEWGRVDTPKDAIFTVEVEQLDGSNGEALYSTKIFSDEDEKRLTTLKETYK